MNGVERFAIWGMLVCMFAPVAAASDQAPVSWHTNVQDAWKATQQQGRPLLVFVTRNDCFYCTKMKDRTYNDLTVAGAIRGGFVPLVLDGAVSSQLLKELKVSVYPSTFVISPQAVIMERIDGYVTADVLSSKLSALRPQLPVAKLVKDP